MISSFSQSKPQHLFTITFKQYDILFSFLSSKESFTITLTNRFAADTFSLKIDNRYIKQRQHLKHLFNTPEELFDCLQGNKQTIIIDSLGQLKFQFKLFGPQKKGKQLIIQLQKCKSMFQEYIQSNNLQLQKQIRAITLNYQLLQNKCKKIEDDYLSLGEKITDLKTVNNTQQIIAYNCLQLRKHLYSSKKIQIRTPHNTQIPIVNIVQNPNNPHQDYFSCMHQMGYIVVTHSKEFQWHSYIKNEVITKSSIYQFVLRGLSTKVAFIGICTEQYFVDKQPRMDYQNPYLISYQTSTGGIFHMTDIKETNIKCAKEDKVDCIIDLQDEKQTVSWHKNRSKIGQFDIVQPLRGKPLYLAILMYQLNDKIKIKIN